MPLSRFCPQTGQEHGNALSCASCLATTSRTIATHPDPEITSPSPVRSHEIPIIDLCSSTPSSPLGANQVFAPPQPTLSLTQTQLNTRFSLLNRTAETYRNDLITRTNEKLLERTPGTWIKLEFWVLL
jgi:hypothetical protein